MHSATTNEIRHAGRRAGFSLVEVVVVMSIIGILATLSVPSFSAMFARSKLRSASEQLRSDINLARGEAVKRNTIIRMNFTVTAGGTPWCYGLRAGAACDCTVTDASSADFCFLDRTDGGVALSSVTNSAQFAGVTLEDTPFTTSTLSFSPVRPSLRAASATLSATSIGASLRIVTSGMGRVRFCSPSATLSGYPAC